MLVKCQWTYSILLLAILNLLPGCSSGPAEVTPSDPWSGRWIDLSHPFDDQTVFWPTASSFRLDTVFVGEAEGGYFYSAFEFCLAEHGGTHLDAPMHFAEGKWAMDEIPVDRLIGPAVLIDVSDRALEDPDYQVGVSDFTGWEAVHGELPEGIIVLIKTGYERYWPDREKYMGTAERGPDAVPKLHFPGIDPDAARWLVAHRDIHAIGLDTPSIDYGQSTLFESHQILYEKNIAGFENLMNLDQLPAKDFRIVALPMKIKGGSGGPLRVVAWLPG